jgi:hypothetical protein
VPIKIGRHNRRPTKGEEIMNRTSLKINNLPDYAILYKYWVVRYVEGEYWFWGAYDDVSRAGQAALEINGIVID